MPTVLKFQIVLKAEASGELHMPTGGDLESSKVDEAHA